MEPVAAPAVRLPSFVIIGAMKSGTTSLGAYLTAHPDAYCALEPHFFDSNFERGLDWYRGYFRNAGDAAAVGEKSPSYMYHPLAIKRLAATLPNAKLVAILRHPVDRAYSHYWHERRLGHETLSFGEALRAEPERLRASPPGHCRFAYMDRGLYLDQLQRVTSLVPRERLLVLLFDELDREPARTFSSLCDFLGIEGSHVPELVGERTNTYRTHRPESLWRAMQRYRLWRWLPAALARRLGRMMEREATYPDVEPAVRRELLDRFAAPNGALEAWLGRDLDAWSF
ncbi:MAG: sulfotransferase family protein [Actinomycetota bacterium]